MLGEETEQLFTKLGASGNHCERMKILVELAHRKIKTREIVKKTHLRDYQIRHYRRVHAKLIPVVFTLFENGAISYSLVKAIASLDHKDQERAAREAIAKRISVHRFRELRNVNPDKRLNDDLERLANSYSEITGLDIQIKADAENGKAGTWFIRYNSLDMFDQITEVVVGKKSGDDEW